MSFDTTNRPDPAAMACPDHYHRPSGARYYGRALDYGPHRVGTAVYNAQTAELLEAAKECAMQRAPYYYDAWRLVTYRERPGLGTMATSAQWVTYVDPEMLRVWPTHVAAAVLIHELEHLLRRHSERCGEREHGRFNIAGDIEINQHIANLPEGVYYPETISAPHGLTGEQYYVLLPESPEDDPGEGSGEGGDGEGNGEPTGAPRPGHPGQCGSAAGGEPRDYEDADERSEYEKQRDDARRESARKSSAKRAMGAGEGTEVREWAEAELGIDRQGWYRAIASVVSSQVANMSGYDGWLWPGRRDMSDMGGAMLPRFTANRPACAVVIDTSGSITESDLDMAVAATHFLSQSADVTVYGCNTYVTRYGNMVPEGLRGGGGTDMRVGIAAAIADGSRLVVVITDGLTPWPTQDEMHGVPLVVGLSLGQGREMAPDYATALPLSAEAG